MAFNLPSLIQPIDNLSELGHPFSCHEIDQIITSLPSNKSPGPDDFNTDFVKKCWPVIAPDFYELCNKFFEGSLCMRSINGSYVTLIPKKSSLDSVGDYRPISLLNTSVKVLTKILANRLQQVITKLVHQNQYGFIKARSIQDCLAWAFEYISLCHKSRKEMVILKLDFEKAFDNLEHAALMEVLRHKGFDDKWIHWVSMILGSGTSEVLLNEFLGKDFTANAELDKEILCPHFYLFLQLIFCSQLSTRLANVAFYGSPYRAIVVRISLSSNMLTILFS
jgi:hypothetical protein